jgi:hypothetical protein
MIAGVPKTSNGTLGKSILFNVARTLKRFERNYLNNPISTKL